jgi:hypothetical protein
MSRLLRRSITAVVLFAVAAVGWVLSHRALEAVAPPVRPGALAVGVAPTPPTEDETLVKQGFPARSADPKDLTKSDSAWEIEWDITNPTNKPGSTRAPSSVLRIASANFMYKDKDGKARWITVVRNLELGELFVPYDPGSPRYNDVAGQAFWIMKADAKLLGPACVAPGKVLRSRNLTLDNKVYKEVHDDGLRWLNDAGMNGPDKGRRGEKLILWTVFYGGNYRYIIEYGFSCDGTITCRLGATARNHSPRQDNQNDVHLHVGCWMFDPELTDPKTANNGPPLNLVQLVRRLPRNPATADGLFRMDVRPFGTSLTGPPANSPALEGSALWVPEEFTLLRIQSATRKNNNVPPQPTCYDLVPLRFGSVRNFPVAGFDFANKDFWVTHKVAGPYRYTQVPSYVGRPPRELEGKAITVWHSSPLLHVPRAEDFGPDGRTNATGVALTAWASFILKPRNLFDRTPFYVP